MIQLNMEKIAEEGKRLLSGVDNITFGISSLPVNGLIFRILGQKGEQLFNYNNKIAALIQQLNCKKSNSC